MQRWRRSPKARPSSRRQELPWSILSRTGAGAHVERDPVAFSDAILGLLETSARLAAARKRAFELAASNFSWGQIQAQLEQMYRSVL